MKHALWQDIQNYFRIRNCIAHHNGFVLKAKNSNRVKKYATEKGILGDDKDEPIFLLNEGFNREVCKTMVQFFMKLMGAYYSTPLPRK